MPALTFHYLENLCASPEFPFSKDISWRKVKRILTVPCDAGNFPRGHNKIPDNHCEEKSFKMFPGFRSCSQFTMKGRHSYTNVTQLVLGSGSHHQEAGEDERWH